MGGREGGEGEVTGSAVREDRKVRGLRGGGRKGT